MRFPLTYSSCRHKLHSALLTQITDSISLFGGWTGACTNTTGNCTVNMTGNKTATATFSAAPKAKIGATPYTSLVAACNAATNGAEIWALEANLTENPIMNLDKSIVLKGGYNTTYTGRSGQPTVLDGTLRIRDGRLTVERFAIK